MPNSSRRYWNFEEKHRNIINSILRYYPRKSGKKNEKENIKIIIAKDGKKIITDDDEEEEYNYVNNKKNLNINI